MARADQTLRSGVVAQQPPHRRRGKGEQMRVRRELRVRKDGAGGATDRWAARGPGVDGEQLRSGW